MPDYNTNNSVIYKIYCEDGSCDYIYYGSSIAFTKRKNHHKTACNNSKNKEHNKKLYEIIRANKGWDNWKMVVIEIYPCESKTHLNMKEQEYIDLGVNNANVIRAYISEEGIKEQIKDKKREYYVNNADKIKEQSKEYNKNNADKIKEQGKEYRKNNAAKIKERNKEYRKNNADKIKELKKEYRKNNADKIKEREKEYRKNKTNKI